MSIAAAYWSIFVTGLMPNNLFNNWCIHESSTVYLKLLRYKLVTMFKEKKKANKKQSMIICNYAALKGGQHFCCIWKHFLCTCTTKNSVTPVRSHSVHSLTSSHWFSGHFRWPTVKVNAFMFCFFTPSDFNIAKYYLTKFFAATV